jgi:tripartite-type tricarboxylate transporter receptor subunit TctC
VVPLLAGFLLAGAASAQSYPSHPIKVIVPWPAGGLVDIVGRSVGERVAGTLGQPVIVENKTGAGGMIGANTVLQAPADGYTLALTTSALNINAALQPKSSRGAGTDFAPVAVAAYAPLILTIGPSVKADNLKELIAVANSRPEGLTYASAGTGSPSHLAAELFRKVAGVKLVHVPYKGAPAAMLDEVAGRVDMQFANAAVALPQIRSGGVKALAVASSQRIDTLPDVPTTAQAGVAGLESAQWIGFLAPKGTPPEIVGRWNAAVTKALSDPKVQAALTSNGMQAAESKSPGEFQVQLDEELGQWQRVVRDAGIQVQ